MGIETWEEFQEAFGQVSSDRGRVLVEQFRPGTEHRCLVVDNKLIAVTRRRPASVLGDGTSSIEELVTAKNQNRGPIHIKLKTGPREVQYLAKQGLSLSSVPEEGVRVFLTGASNIHAGGDAIDATEDISASEKRFIERASRVIPGLRLAGFDVLLPRFGVQAEPSIIEVNHSPMTSMHHLPWEGKKRNVSAAIMDAMFPLTKK
ncbi:hypothetical protein [Citricoccus sp. NR2]|uniref:hypothetical protein n=1 Tax=Citricoccus sp. NR2 TaxID=3004095 RepID=UPI0022DDBF80|nr:hypothetical protein [Citricoccus sp. NR2]WBL19772.1 hypothetical protein O1A05_03495 [Citricoccus sp. NR2]